MKKIIIVACSLLCGYTTINNAKITPIKLETGMLAIADGTVITWKTISFIKKYKKQLNQFMHRKYTFSTGAYNLLECVRLEDSGILPEDSMQMHAAITQEFISFSEQFLHYLQTVKASLVILIEEDCTKRSRSNSTLLKWAHIPIGDEQKLFNSEITSYRALCSFCVDIIRFLEDLEYSCPKVTKGYAQEEARRVATRNQVDTLLALDNRVLSKAQYKELLLIINNQKGHMNKEAITTLYETHIKTLCA